MKLLNFNIIYLCFFLILGIISQQHFGWQLRDLVVLALIPFITFLILSFVALEKKLLSKLYLLTTALVFVFTGAILLALKAPENIPEHYSKSDLSQPIELVLRIEKRLKPTNYHEKYYARVLNINGRSTRGRLLLNVIHDSLSSHFSVDDILITRKSPEQLPKPLNPYQFDYGKYLENQQVYRQITLKESEFHLISSKPSSVIGYADRLRQTINRKLEVAGFSNTSIQMINALLLGQKQDIDEDIYNNYINVGTVHILAVSGLHVGILLWILTWLFQPLLYLKHGRLLRAITILILLWSFAIIAGLSPSVTRAVSMFSIISIAMHLKRETNIYNTLATSAFILLLVNPQLLFEVGFQLSYAAVLSIVVFQPLIVSLWTPKYKVGNWIWQIFGVTLAAQLGVAPLSLYYFHQFPGLFFVSNLVVVPLLGFILSSGLLVVILSLAGTTPPFLVKSFELIIGLLNNFIAWVANFEGFLFKDIPFSWLQMILVYAIIISAYRALRTKSYGWVVSGLVSILVLQCFHLYEGRNPNAEAFIVFNKSRYSILGQQNHKHLTLYHNMQDSLLKQQSLLSNYRVGSRVTELKMQPLERIYKFDKHSILAVDSSGVYKNLSFTPRIVLLQNSPQINLNRMIKTIAPDLIIADASNYKSYIRRWEATCRKQNTTFHYTAKDGAYIISE